MKTMLSMFMLLSISLYNVLSAQENNYCGYQPSQRILNLSKDPNSLLNQRIRYLKEIPLQQLYNIQQLEKTNGNYQTIPPIVFQGEAEDEKQLLSAERVIPIVAHIVRKTDGTEGLTVRQLDDAIIIANRFYSGFNMRFDVCEINYIDSDNIFNTTFNSEADRSTKSTRASYNKLNVKSRNVARKLNIYFVPNSNTSWAWSPDTDERLQHILMLNSHAINGVTLSHEIGHWFNLLHTHDEGDELVDGSNCDKAGDFVCDTPADPNLSGLVDRDCSYNTRGRTIEDDNGDAYSPDTRNMMAYTLFTCRNGFSKGQIYRMQAALLGMQEDRGYSFNPCGGVQSRIADYKWTEGWTTAKYFIVNSKPYFLLLREKGVGKSGNNVQVRKVGSQGKIGQPVKEYKWTEGWTTAEFFTKGRKTYLFLMREKGLSGSKNNVHIHQMNFDGTIGKRIAGYRWKEGWTTARFYQKGGLQFLFLLREKGLSDSQKNVHIHQITADGKIGKRIADYKWTEGWTTAEFFEGDNQLYLFLLRAKGLSGSGKNIHIHSINQNGSIGPLKSSHRWTEGWTTAKFYEVDAQRYVLLLKEKGVSGTGDNAHVHRVTANGAIGLRTAAYQWTPGWTTADIYKEPDATCLFLLKEKGLSGSRKNVHIERMK